jgi:hypothetical protein
MDSHTLETIAGGRVLVFKDPGTRTTRYVPLSKIDQITVDSSGETAYIIVAVQNIMVRGKATVDQLINELALYYTNKQ